MQYRIIGPFRGGRTTTLSGVPNDIFTYYMGATGGVWKTTDGGTNWNYISDGFFNTTDIGDMGWYISSKTAELHGLMLYPKT